MPTRFYLPSAGSAAASPAFDSSWEYTGGGTRLPLATTPTNTARTGFSVTKTTSAAPGDVLVSQYVSSATLPAGSISGTFDVVVDTSQATTTADAFLQVVIRVVSGDGSTVRGTLYAGQATTTVSSSSTSPAYEFALGTNSSSARSRILSGVSLSSVTAQAGDRLVVDIGYRSSNVGTTRLAYLWLGDPTAAPDSALAVDLNGDGLVGKAWIEFSQSLFGSAPATVSMAGSVAAPSWTLGAAFDLDVTPLVYDVALTGPLDAPTWVLDGSFSVAVPLPADIALTGTLDAPGWALDGAFDLTATPLPADIELVGTFDAPTWDLTSAFALAVPSDPIDVDLSTFIDLFATTAWDGTSLSATAGAAYFTFPLYVDPATTYAIEVDYTQVTGTPGGIYISSLLGVTEGEADASAWELLGSSAGLTGTGTATIAIGPGLMGWSAAMAAGELFLVFDVSELDITGIRVDPPLLPFAGIPPVESDVTNDAHKLTLGGWGVVQWEPAIVHAPFAGVRHSVISAIAYGPVTMQGTRPVFTYSEADRPRLRQRILLGGRDVTYDRGIPTPDVEYELADLLLYGPGSLDLPAYVAAWETGTEATERASEGRRVKVQLVDDFTDPENPTVEATVYKGFVMNPGVNGRNLTVELGGDAQGRLALRDSHVLFRDVLDISRLVWRELTDVGVRYLPRLGEPGIGIRSLNFGGTSKLEKVEELLARAVKKDGTQRIVMPDEQGVYRISDKDTVTVHYSVFVDDAFTVADLSSDIAEKPNAIYATAIAPSGMRIDGAAVPGLISAPAPDYPMASGNAFGIGTTNEDTDTGDGISVMVNRLGAVGLLDIRDTPGGFDEDVEDALKKLQVKARTTGPVGQMNPALWAALWDLDETGRSGRWSSIQPTAEDPSVQRYLRSASGAVVGLNPDWDPDAIQVDESIDMGTGFRERQVQNWAETRVHAPGAKVWYGTITVNLGAVLAGQVNVGATITSADLVDARLVRPGQNLWVPNFDGGTLFGVSGVQVRGDSVVFTVDTRHRPAREVWERLQVRRETRNDPARRMLGTRQSTQRKDAVRGFISWGGIIDRDVPLEPGWNVIEVVVGDHGTISWLDMTVQTVTNDGGTITIDGHEYAVALFGKPITAARLNDLVPAPLAENGDRPWRRKATRATLNAHGLLYSAGTRDEPCGYGSDLKTDAATLTGRHVDDASVTYDVDNYVARLAIWVGEGTAGAKLLKGRVMWPVLEGGV